MQLSQPAPAPQQEAPQRASAARRILLAAGLVALFLAVALGAALAMLPSERIARVASERAEAALGLPVAIGDVSLAVWPAPAVALEDARLGEAGEPVVAARKVLLRPRILPLLSGRVQVDEIALESPELRLVVDREGRLNLPLSADSAQDAGGGDVEFAIDRFRIRDGLLSYHDQRDGTSLRLQGIEQQLRIDGRLADGELARVGLDGSLSVASVGAELPGRLRAPVRGLSLAVSHSGSLDRERDRLDLASLRLQVQRVALEGSGRVEALSDSTARRVDIALRTDEFSADDLAGSFPEGFLESLLTARDGSAGQTAAASAERPEVRGRAAIQARIQGLATRDSLPSLEGVVRLSEVAARLRERDVLAGVTGSVVFSNDVVATRALEGRLLGEPFRLQLRVENFAAPAVRFAATGTARLEELAAVAGQPDSIQASGRIPFDLQGLLLPGTPARSSLTGTVELSGVRMSTPSLLQPVRVASGRLRFAGEQARAEDLSVEFGDSRLRVDAGVQGWLPAVLGDSTRLPVVSFDAAAGLLDLDALLGPSESEYAPLLFARLADQPVNGRTAAEAAAAAGLSLPELPRGQAAGRFRAERLVSSGLEYRQVDAEVQSSPDALSVPRASFAFMGGLVETDLALQRGANEATLVLDYRLRNVGAEPFFSKLTPFRGHLSGLLSLEGQVTMQLDEHLLPVRPTVQASGTVGFRDGWLASWPVLREAGKSLGLAGLDTLTFREWSGSFRIAGPLVTLDRARKLGGDIEAEVAGSFDFGGRLDLGVVAYLPKELGTRAGPRVRQASAALAGADGRVPVGLRITGEAAAPRIALDLSSARDNVVAQAREKAREEVQEAAAEATRELARRVLPDSAGVSPEGIGQAVQEQVGNRLRGLFRRQAPTGAAAPAPGAAPASTAAAAPAAPEEARDTTGG